MTRAAGRSSSKPTQALAQIDAGNFQSVYLLFGSDSAAAEEIIAKLKERLIVPGFESFDFESRHAEDMEIALLVQNTRQPPFGSKRRLMIIRQLDRLRKSQIQELLTGLAKTPDSCTAVVTCDYDRNLQATFKETGVDRFVVDLRQPAAPELAPLIHRWAHEMGVTIDNDATRILVDIAGSETGILRGELAKLASSINKGERVTAARVRELAGHSREYELQEYIDHVLEQDIPRATTVLERLENWGEEPIKIIAWLANGLIGIAAGLGRALPANMAWRFPAAMLRRWDLDHVRRCLQRLYEINRDILRGRPEPFVQLQLFTICTACPGTGAYCSLSANASPPDICMRRRRGRRPGRNAANG